MGWRPLERRIACVGKAKEVVPTQLLHHFRRRRGRSGLSSPDRLADGGAARETGGLAVPPCVGVPPNAGVPPKRGRSS
jgi:hypothetical protein